jgi:hypothetical protein
MSPERCVRSVLIRPPAWEALDSAPTNPHKGSKLWPWWQAQVSRAGRSPRCISSLYLLRAVLHRSARQPDHQLSPHFPRVALAAGQNHRQGQQRKRRGERGRQQVAPPPTDARQREPRALPAAPSLFRRATNAHRLGEIPGEGFEPSRPLKGTADFKSAAYHQFRHPGESRVARGGPIRSARSRTRPGPWPALSRRRSRSAGEP